MATSNDVQVIAIEEHYNDPELSEYFEGRDRRTVPHIISQLNDLGELRLGEMDESTTASSRRSTAIPIAFRASRRCRRPIRRPPPMSSSVASTSLVSRAP